MRHVLVKLVKVKLMLRKKSDVELLSLSVTDDPVTKTKVKLLCICSGVPSIWIASRSQECFQFYLHWKKH
jgi:hypothetical protein